MLRCLARTNCRLPMRHLTTAAVASAPLPPPPNMAQASHVAAAVDFSHSPKHSYNQQHLKVVSKAIEQVILEQQKAQVVASTNSETKTKATNSSAASLPTPEESVESESPVENSEAQEKVQAAWDQFESALSNAHDCVQDVSTIGPEEAETAEEALSVAQAAYLDVLDLCRELQLARKHHDPASQQIKHLRQQLDDVLLRTPTKGVSKEQ